MELLSAAWAVTGLAEPHVSLAGGTEGGTESRWGLGIGGVLLLAWAVEQLWRLQRRLVSRLTGRVAQGVVVDVDRKEHGDDVTFYRPKVEYVTRDGTRHVGWARSATERNYRVGRRVLVHHEADPTVFSVGSTGRDVGRFVWAGMWAAAGIYCLVTALSP
ncbi:MULTISPECIES: DUF3592 domain-containing protein [Protofrankia]|uniref:DUF3592 domain-containing protein n=1 Tax=Protofrankia coriariae TaxID=1562887 RepID=A0ABR5F768_9ACTN|nr:MULTISPECIES: DUF3592 domain-containing protein [Protofrankia]KLL12468.1 hypothetical protein FrCorBMG51_04025 [Protofrankia coriariae]ONH35541.1 hypothetical protein BL254_11405 [Protofrankia sp. BMG5.30]